MAAGRLPDLVARLRLDTGDLKRAEGEVRAFGATTGTGLKPGQNALQKLGLSFKKAEGEVASFGGRLGGVARGSSTVLQKLSSSATTSGALISTAFAGIGIGAGLAVAAGVSKFVALTAEIRRFQRVSGASAHDASLLVGSMKLLGVEPAAAGKAFGILSKTIETNGHKLAAQGIEVARNKDHSVNLVQTLFSVSDAYNKTSDQAKKNTIALTAFGRGGLELVPILKRGSAGLKELNDELARSGLVFDQKALDQGKDLGLATRELKTALTGLEIKAARAFIPFITSGTQALTTIEHLAGGVNLLSFAIGGVAAKLAAVGLAKIGAGLIGLGGGLSSAAGGAGLLTAAAGGLVVPVAGLGVAAVVTSRKVDEAVPALDRLDKGFVSLERRIPLVGKFLAGLDSKTLGLAESGHKVAASEEDVAKALEDSAKAAAAAKKAADDYAAALKRIFAAGQSLVGSELAVGNAESALADAHTNVADKERALGDARAGLGAGAKALESATRSLSAAQRDNARSAEDAAASVADAQAAYDEAVAKRQEGSGQKAVDDAAKALAKSKESQRRDAEDAAQRITDAQKDLADAKKNGSREKDIADASRDLAGARRDESGAVEALAGATATLAENQNALAGRTTEAADKYDIYRRKLIELKDSIAPDSPLRKNLEDLINHLPPKEVLIKITADTTQPDAAIKGLIDLVGQLAFGPTTPLGDQAGQLAFGPKHHTGGLVGGLGHEVAAVLQPGEFVVRRRAVAAIGVPALARINRYHEGGLVGDGTSGGGGTAVTFNLPPTDVRQLAHEVVRLTAWERRQSA